MQQIEDLSAIIRKRDNQIEDLNHKINELTNQCRIYHQQVIDIKSEHAEETQARGAEILRKIQEKNMNNSNRMGDGRSSQGRNWTMDDNLSKIEGIMNKSRHWFPTVKNKRGKTNTFQIIVYTW